MAVSRSWFAVALALSFCGLARAQDAPKVVAPPRGDETDVEEPIGQLARARALEEARRALAAKTIDLEPLRVVARSSDIPDEVLAACQRLVSGEEAPEEREWLARASLAPWTLDARDEEPSDLHAEPRAPRPPGPRAREARDRLARALLCMRGQERGEQGPSEALAIAREPLVVSGGATPGSPVARRHQALAQLIVTHALNRLGRRAEAEKALGQVLSDELTTGTYWVLALVEVARGDADQAMELLRRLVEARPDAAARGELRLLLRQDPLLAPLRTRPDWAALTQDEPVDGQADGRRAPFRGAPYPADAAPSGVRPTATVGGAGWSMRIEVPRGYRPEQLPDGRVALVRARPAGGVPPTIVIGQVGIGTTDEAEARRWLERVFPGARVRHAARGTRWLLVEVGPAGPDGRVVAGRAWLAVDERHAYYVFLGAAPGELGGARRDLERVVDGAVLNPTDQDVSRCAWCARDLRGRRSIRYDAAGIERRFCDEGHARAWRAANEDAAPTDAAALQAVLDRIPDFGQLLAARRAREEAGAQRELESAPGGVPSPDALVPGRADAPRALQASVWVSPRPSPATIAAEEAEAEDEGRLLLVLGALAVTFVCGALLGSTLRPRR